MAEEDKNQEEAEVQPASTDAEPNAEAPSASTSEPEHALEDTTGTAPAETEDNYEEDEEEVEFDLDAQVEEFKRQIEEEPDNCVHHYNLGEALTELGHTDEALEEFALALELDKEKEYSSIIHFARGDLYYQVTISGIQGTVVRSSVGLHSAHKAGDSITEVNEEDYTGPLEDFEMAIKYLDTLKADEEIVEYVSTNAPQRIADTYYKWGSDLIDKSRQIRLYGEETKDVQLALKHLKKTLQINPNHSQAHLMVKYAKKMLLEGWKAFDEYGFEAKSIQGSG
jgi:tetratricopeptide (TPR) repeat protein